jgi:glycosyltransferase involved in cell wall biosynthesis
MNDQPPLRALFVDEGVLGGRTLMKQLRTVLAGIEAIEPTFVTVPPPNRVERLLLRRLRFLGDGDFSSLRWRLRWSWRTRRLLKKHRSSVDVAFINTQASALLARGAMKRLPCVLSVDATARQYAALEYEGPPDRWTPLQTRILAALERRAVRRAARVMAWTGWVAASLREQYGIAEERLVTLHPGLDAQWWGAAATARRETDDGPMKVLFVGNDVERKGLGSLTAAAERLGDRVQLDVVSGEAIEENDRLRAHHGVEAQSEELRALYSGADVFALPTRADMAPWVVLEAMAAGLPVLATRVGAIAELSGDAGVLVEPGDVDGIAAALEGLLDPGRRRRLGDRALTRIRADYDSATQTGLLVDLLGEAAGREVEPGKRRMRRRTFIAIGAGVVGVGLIAPYVPLLTDDQMTKLVASHLGIEEELAAKMLERVHDEYGRMSYDAHAAAFALAVRNPAAAVLPESVRRKAIDGIVEPMLSAPAASLAYAVTGSDPGAPACAGLVRAS